MHVEARAPGKLVLLGEYAVLEGAPALVLAVNRQARVRLQPSADGAWEVVSPTLGLAAHMAPDSSLDSPGSVVPPKLEWIATLLEHLAHMARVPASRAELDSDQFFLEHHGERVKLGLGSNAALTVALLGAWHRLAEREPPTLSECVAAHCASQRGRGSGIDAAAALLGGLVRYQVVDQGPLAAPATLPHGVHWCCVFSGRSASTGTMLAAMEVWRLREPGAYAHHMQELAACASRGVAACARNSAGEFLQSIGEYRDALSSLGTASGLDIASREHRELGSIAASCGVTYKSCGAGSGDVGVAFATDPGLLRAFSVRAANSGYPAVDLEMAAHGLETHSIH
ncbi:MAG TPA: hypothetical protein VFK16_07695 [Gemmatimonadaceae bacterium]|jgi:phosphomevalonate kinase|nr:hypothetical protein [Gemmatimonadaceae bacterium]